MLGTTTEGASPPLYTMHAGLAAHQPFLVDTRLDFLALHTYNIPQERDIVKGKLINNLTFFL